MLVFQGYGDINTQVLLSKIISAEKASLGVILSDFIIGHGKSQDLSILEVESLLSQVCCDCENEHKAAQNSSIGTA